MKQGMRYVRLVGTSAPGRIPGVGTFEAHSRDSRPAREAFRSHIMPDLLGYDREDGISPKSEEHQAKEWCVQIQLLPYSLFILLTLQLDMCWTHHSVLCLPYPYLCSTLWILSLYLFSLIFSSNVLIFCLSIVTACSLLLYQKAEMGVIWKGKKKNFIWADSLGGWGAHKAGTDIFSMGRVWCCFIASWKAGEGEGTHTQEKRGPDSQDS